MPKDNKKTLLKEVTARAATDPAFRQRLLTAPEAAIYEVFGTRLPPGHRIRFIEKPADVDTLIVLPNVRASGELADDDLDAVAGGGPDDPPTW